jgi:hypothetical protein
MFFMQYASARSMSEITLGVPWLERLEMPVAEACGFRRPSYVVEYSARLARDRNGMIVAGVTQDEARKLAEQQGCRLSTAAEECELTRIGWTDNAFDDFCGRGGLGSFGVWTETILVIPDGQKNECEERDDSQLYQCRIVRECDRDVGRVAVPRCGGEVGIMWSVFGVPTAVSTENPHEDRSRVHFYFNPSLHEAAVSCEAFRHSEKYGCFRVAASSELLTQFPYIGFRLVRGKLPEIVPVHVSYH